MTEAEDVSFSEFQYEVKNMDISQQASKNLLGLSQNPYPGRGIVLGRAPDGNPVQIYWVMGRSKSSRNRILELVPDKHGWLRTRVADPSGFSIDPRLLIYTAMAEEPNTYVVGNGAQTDAVIQDGNFILESGDWQYEPDSPNFTPRITGLTYYVPGDSLDTRLVMLRKSLFGESCDWLNYTYGEVAPGYGYYISTYEGDGNPLPSFHGEPLIVPINNANPAEIAQAYWSVLNEDNRVALAVKVIPFDRPSEIRIINRYICLR